ncbi:aldehyde ferredoxin oxidoreductase C-terminal domain-containing protein [Desulfolutivibrio sulfoxidireducens]|uniref:aldehyde ferredoxin oxidoreductase C-terminal domain-containing protein n=1 Tax=Desulfolutivibrio sulfoxidireducens TaxID=2773299 RepID=UPI00159CF8F2|nr:aldehyde ferredoxin oxidoreductase C-terminal domain-containing protein [Desulfolutivibrio sulfoxidireducens]QLA21044.1 aldehyde ferredoxin oxidoreductase [Desulfolutivibrio sulfoxidireducens]
MRAKPGAILRVHLGPPGLKTETVPHPSPSGFPGGRGLAVMELFHRAHLPFDDPDMPLCLAAGPLAGTAAPLCGRAVVASVSPLTNTLLDAQAGGRLAVELARSGLLGVSITGRALVPSGLEIVDGRTMLRPCPDLAGLCTPEIFSRLAFPGEVLRVGPAAASGAALAAVVVGQRGEALRGGLGLSFAAKNLVYVAIHGTNPVPVADPARLGHAREDVLRLVAASPALAGGHGFARFGTAALLDLTDSLCMTPTRNFRDTRFAAEKMVNAPALARLFSPRRVGCLACPVPCAKIAHDGRMLPGIDALSHLTALVDNADPRLAVAATALCADLGLDPVSAASALACHAEITGEALFSSRIPGLLGDMAHGRGLGRELAGGAAAYARGRGRPETAMAVKSLELPAFDPRGACGLALSYAVSTKGGCYLRALAIGHEVLRKPVATDRFEFAGKARMVAQSENALAALESLAACPLVFLAASLEEYAPILSAVTGVETTAGELLRIGERVVAAERMANARRGFSAADDDLPARFFTEPGTPGEDFAVPAIDRQAFLAARAAYYRIRGLTPDGLPGAETAREPGRPWTD